MRLLLVEDNERFAALLKRGLAGAGFVVDVLPTAKDATSALRESRFEIVVLDLGLPDADGLDVLGEMRRRQDATPVLILTARGSLEDRVIGLQSGADDYLVKPFALEELVARLQALLRRPGNLLGVALKLGNVSLDTVARQVFVGNQPIFLSAREIAVLSICCVAVDGSSRRTSWQTISMGCRKKSGQMRSRSMCIDCASSSPKSAPPCKYTPCAGSGT